MSFAPAPSPATRSRFEARSRHVRPWRQDFPRRRPDRMRPPRSGHFRAVGQGQNVWSARKFPEVPEARRQGYARPARLGFQAEGSARADAAPILHVFAARTAPAPVALVAVAIVVAVT